MSAIVVQHKGIRYFPFSWLRLWLGIAGTAATGIDTKLPRVFIELLLAHGSLYEGQRQRQVAASLLRQRLVQLAEVVARMPRV